MKRGVRVVGAPDVAAGFAAAGLAAVTVEAPAEAARRIGDLLGDPQVGVIVVDERLYDILPEELRARFARQPLPMVVPFPGPAWTPRLEGAEAYIVELLRRAIGYRVRLR
jgi:V/A-type H+-transporting ATPase subunit F